MSCDTCGTSYVSGSLLGRSRRCSSRTCTSGGQDETRAFSKMSGRSHMKAAVHVSEAVEASWLAKRKSIMVLPISQSLQCSPGATPCVTGDQQRQTSSGCLSELLVDALRPEVEQTLGLAALRHPGFRFFRSLDQEVDNLG